MYDVLKEDYISHIDTNKKSDSVGGNYYGRTQLFSTRGTHFEKEIGYEHHGGTYGINKYYNFVFKVGGKHYQDFETIKSSFFSDFQKRTKDILKKYNIINGKLEINGKTIKILTTNEISNGTNFNTYCGIEIFKDNKKINAENFI